MGTTVHEDAAEQLLEDVLAEPAWAADLARMKESLRSGTYNQQLLALVGQTQREPAYWSDAQVAAAIDVLEGLAHGRLVRRRIQVGASPSADADRTGNADRLLAVPSPFLAELDMDQNGADSDGALIWDAPVTLWRALGFRVLGQQGLYGSLHAPFTAQPGRAPLEVGYTLPSRTMAHLMVEGQVGRWAYGDDEICLLIDLTRIGPFIATRPLPTDIVPARSGL